MPLKPPIRAICFDVDGTLSDSDDLAVQRVARVLSLFRWLGVRDIDTLARRLVMALETPFNELYATADRHGIDDEIIRLIHFVNKIVPLSHGKPTYLVVPGVAGSLARLARNYKLAIVSARPRPSTLAFLEATGLRGFFRDCIATAETCEHTKPSPEPVLWAAKCLGVAPAECVMVGDTTVDILAGKAAGAQTVGVLCGFGREDELRRAGADLILPSTALLPEALP